MEKERLLLIVVKAKQGDKQALSTLFTETYNDVYYFALKTVKDETLAADITQETFITIFQNLDTLNDPVAYPAWSRQITYRHCLQHLKKQNREVAVEENEDGSTIFDTIEEDRTEFIPEEQLDKEDFKNTILKMVDGLPEEQRTAILLYYYDELSIKEIAEIQGVSEGTVKSRLNYGRKAIKSSVEDYEKKHNIKLHCAGVLPLLLWLFASDFGASAMSATTAQTVATGVSAATGTTLSVPSLIKYGAKTVLTLWQKIVVGIAALSVLVGGTVATVNHVNKENESKPTTQVLESFLDESNYSQPFGTWRGVGTIEEDGNISYENQFILGVNEQDETHIRGSLTVLLPDGSSYWQPFSGKGTVREDGASIVYHLSLKDTVLTEDGRRKVVRILTTQYDLQYYIEKDTFEWLSSVYKATMEKEK